MAKSALPLLLLVGAAAVVVTKKKKKSKSKGLPSLEEEEEEEKGEEPEEKAEDEPEEKAEEEEETPAPKPTPIPIPPKPKPTPDLPTPMPDPTPGPSEQKRPVGPSGDGSCVKAIYDRNTQYIDPGIAEVLNTEVATAFPDAMFYFYIKRETQAALYNAVATRFLNQLGNQEYRTVGPVILRQELDKLAPSCGWDEDTDKMDEPAKLVWDDAKRIATLAAWMTGFEDPAQWQLFQTNTRRTVTRDSLGMPDPGFMGASQSIAPNQRVEIIATQADTFENAEHLIGKVTKLTGPNGEDDQFEIHIVGTFNGKNVAPKLTAHHGFKFFKEGQSSNAYFSKKGPTGVYRIYPVGTE